MSAEDAGIEARPPVEPAPGTDWWGSLWTEEDALELVLKRREKNGDENQVDQLIIAPGEFGDFEDFVAHVRKEYGGGKWVIYRRGDTGRFLPGSRKQFNTSGPVRDLSSGDDATPPRQAAGQDLGALLLQMQAAADARMEKLVETLAARQPAQQVDELDRLEKYSRILSPQAKEKSLIEQAVEKKILDFLDSGMGGDDSGFGWVRPLVDQLGQSLAQAAVGGAGDEGTTPPAALPAPANTADPMQRLRAMVGGLVQLAANEASPTKAAANLKAQAGENWPQLAAIFQREDALKLATQLVPQAAQHAEWFEQFRAAALGRTEGASGGATGRKSGERRPGSSAKRAAG
jgi:hypothetical protein